jgi:Domain of unknown function (DUF4340)
MNLRGLIVAVVILAGLGGVLYWSQHRKPPAENAATSASATPVVLKVNTADVTQLTIKQKQSEPVTVQKADGNKWQITEPKPYRADQETVAGMLSTLSGLNADRVVDDKATDRKQYGLDPPAVELDITGKSHGTQQLLLGDDTPAGGDVYAAVAGSPKVFTVSSYNKTSLAKSLNDLRDKSLLTVDADKVSHITLVRKGQEMEFGRTKDGWQILKPPNLREDNSALSLLVSSLTSAKMDLSGGTSDAAADFAKGAPIATAKVTADSGTQTIEVRKDKNDYYAKSSVVEGPVKVDSSLGTALDKNLDDFRNKKLFDFGFDEPNKIELHSGSQSWLYTRSGEDWSSDGKKVDASAVGSLVSKLRDLTATKFVTSGFTHPEIEATVTSNDGKRVEKVLISKSGKDSVAKRDGEPTLYQLDSASVDDLAKLAGEVKPAATPAK